MRRPKAMCRRTVEDTSRGVLNIAKAHCQEPKMIAQCGRHATPYIGGVSRDHTTSYLTEITFLNEIERCRVTTNRPFGERTVKSRTKIA